MKNDTYNVHVNLKQINIKQPKKKKKKSCLQPFHYTNTHSTKRSKKKPVVFPVTKSRGNLETVPEITKDETLPEFFDD